MIARLNIIDRIMIPVLLLMTLFIMVNAYIVGYSTTHNDNPGTVQWILLAVGFVYVLYQAIHIGSPLLTAISTAVVLAGFFGPIIVQIDWWYDNIWDSLGRGVLAAEATIFAVAIFFLLPIAVMTCIAWVVQRKQKKLLQ